MFYKIVIYIILCNKLIVESLPQAKLSVQNAIDSFQNAVQQQTFHSILLSIEGRLRNLDNIYSMQLSETLKSKLDQYHRKLESLDIKLIRLESLVMLNLNKISENISMKNYKDDIAVTQTYRRLDNIYDNLSHRINYMDRKSDMALDKLQNKIDTTLLRIEKMEENMIQRNSDMESELSETLFLIEDLKTSSANNEQNIVNISNFLNQTVSNTPLLNSINTSIQNLIKDLNQSFIQRIEKLENTSTKNLIVSEDSNSFLKSMKLELKEDFNEYANKVADMNMDIWKRNDMANESLKTIETVANSTLTEVQNGVRSLMIQIGKLSKKGIMNSDEIYLESLKKSFNLSLEKIITNQELFLESCHRVQMDESQIESEISVLLGKLIDMLEKKMTTVMKDLKSLEKTVKNHDSRTTKNIIQANTNILSLFEKTTRSYEFNEKELQEIKFYINALFTFIQDVLPKNTGVNQIIEDLVNDLSINITSLINSIYINSDIKWIQLGNNFTKQNDITGKINNQLKNMSEVLLNTEFSGYKYLLSKIDNIVEDMRLLLSDIKKTLTHTEVRNNTTNLTSTTNNQEFNNKNCDQNSGNLIDLRADGINCIADDTENVQISNINDTKSSENVILFDDNRAQSNETIKITQSPSLKPENDEQFKKEIINIFGTPAPVITFITENMLNKNDVYESKNKKSCKPVWANLIDMRADSNDNSVECDENRRTLKKKTSNKNSKSGGDDTLEYEGSTQDTVRSTENPTTTENSTENELATEIFITEILKLTTYK